jgi:tRNA U34 2-thiouridine synthase MnmA/TrmU
VSQDQSPLFYTGEIELAQFNAINKISDNQNVKVRFRHGGDLRDCVFNIRDNKYIITLKENERGIAQGQAAVLYIGTRCIGGGTVISKCLNQN